MQHFFENIQGWSRFLDLYKQQVDSAVSGAHFVEVGAWKGRSTAFMAVEILNSGKAIKFDVVDTWQGSQEHQNDLEIKEGTLFNVFKQNLAPVEGTFTSLQMTSLAAAEQYADASLDFVFIDASHEYDDVKADIEAWLPKVKPGGTLAGDDTDWPGVRKAITELLPNRTERGAYWVYKNV